MPKRVVVAESGSEGPDHGAEVLARALRDAGIEVIYAGRRQTPEQIVETAIQEDADAIGLSLLSGEQSAVLTRVVVLLAERDAADIVVLCAGALSEEDVPHVIESGVAKVFVPGVTAAEIARWVDENVSDASAASA